MLARAIGRAEEGFIALLLAAMTCLTFTQVVLRYVFNSSLIWALETITYMFAWLILFGISYGVRVHGHIGVDLLVKALPLAARRAAGLLAIALCVLYAGIMLYGAWGYVGRIRMLGALAEDIPVQRWILASILPVGFALLAFRLLEQGWAILQGRAAGFELADEARVTLHGHLEDDGAGRGEGPK
ncbi:TRAP transporter small permease [Marinimicrococcus flavescens]|uniref:TRAP transporter small permease protein n=1 Tax=Marinimicrococcus flavescens TaxID=3031815 RepID=A0AAP3XSZ3_9PROT|nr:TRAP transporter small permease [Marinimicrococcus flavescens]